MAYRGEFHQLFYIRHSEIGDTDRCGHSLFSKRLHDRPRFAYADVLHKLAGRSVQRHQQLTI
jgi:hypothetical protein